MSKKTNNWLTGNGCYFLESITNALPELPVGLFRLEASPRGLYLQHTGDKFIFPYKIYGLERPFIERVKKTYLKKNSNVGVLLNGVKGTGKTVTAELIANELHMPVIVINQNFQQATATFINSIEQDIILFFDEYEKIYSDREHSILTVMDGVLSNEYRRLFLLTTNNAYINENMLSRPSRIRYVKEFKDLSHTVIEEIVDDMLLNTSLRDDVIRYISTLRIITVDIVKSVIDEVNMHDESPEVFKEIFNVSVRDEKYNVFDITEGEDKAIKIFEDVKVSPFEFNSDSVAANGNRFTVNNTNIGVIKKLINRVACVVEITVRVPKGTNVINKTLHDAVVNNNLLDKDDLEEMLESAEELDGDSPDSQLKIAAVQNLAKSVKTITRVLKLERNYGSHYSFTRYAGGYMD